MPPIFTWLHTKWGWDVLKKYPFNRKMTFHSWWYSASNSNLWAAKSEEFPAVKTDENWHPPSLRLCTRAHEQHQVGMPPAELQTSSNNSLILGGRWNNCVKPRVWPVFCFPTWALKTWNFTWVYRSSWAAAQAQQHRNLTLEFRAELSWISKTAPNWSPEPFLLRIWMKHDET